MTNVVAFRGIIYSATGAAHIAEAIASAASSLRYNDLPHLIFCNQLPNLTPASIEFRAFSASGNPYLDKINNIRCSPFEQTLFLDTDTFITANISELFDLMLRFDIAAAHVPGYTKCDDQGQSEAFYDFNTGVIAYRSTDATAEFLSNWAQLCERWLKQPPFRLTGKWDQAPFRRALWESSLSLYVLTPEYNYRSIFPGRLVGKAKIIHGRSTNYEQLAAYLNAQDGPRTFLRFSPDWAW
jgi:hypothetical protein